MNDDIKTMDKAAEKEISKQAIYNMDMLFDLIEVQSGVTAYDMLILNISQILKAVGELAEGIPRTKFVGADMIKTRESLVGYAANKAIDFKEACIRFGEVYQT